MQTEACVFSPGVGGQFKSTLRRTSVQQKLLAAPFPQWLRFPFLFLLPRRTQAHPHADNNTLPLRRLLNTAPVSALDVSTSNRVWQIFLGGQFQRVGWEPGAPVESLATSSRSVTANLDPRRRRNFRASRVGFMNRVKQKGAERHDPKERRWLSVKDQLVAMMNEHLKSGLAHKGRANRFHMHTPVFP